MCSPSFPVVAGMSCHPEDLFLVSRTLTVRMQMCLPCAYRHHVPTEAKRILWIRGMRMRIAATSSVLQADSFASCVGASCGDGFSDSDIFPCLVAPIASVGLWSLRSICIAGAQHFTINRALLGSDFTIVCLPCRRDPPRAIACTETEKDTQDSHGCHQGQARRTHAESHRKCCQTGNSRHIFTHDVPTFQHIDHYCVEEGKPYGARAGDQCDSARMKHD